MMKQTLLRNLLAGAFLVLFMSSCVKDKADITTVSYTSEELQTLQQVLDLSPERDRYLVELSRHMLMNNAIPPVINDAKAVLGRVLFYDTKLSLTDETSCASCHDQKLAFSDDKAFSDGINGQVTKRNSLPLGSTANFSSSYDGGGGSGLPFSGGIGFFWDERANSIAHQSSMTIADDIEMGMDLDDLSVKLAQEQYYKILFRKAYDDETITPERITDAIQEFVNAFVSSKSKFDKGLDQANSVHSNFSNFTQSETRGKSLFISNCTNCHSADQTLGTGINVANNGLDINYEDQGMGDRTGVQSHNGVFKVPFLRNVELTGPYMHDGRFDTLEEVIEHYSSGIQAHENLSFILKDESNQPKQFNFSETDKADLVAFLKTLTDDEFIQDERFADPFK